MAQHKKKRIAVLFGGMSPEHDVSVVSAQQVMDALDPRDYETVPIYMDFENRFYTNESFRDVRTYRPRPLLNNSVKFAWGELGPQIIDSESNVVPIDCVLPVFHGKFGEDGTVQSYFNLKGIPCTGFSPDASQVAMRKDWTKIIIKDDNVPVLDHQIVTRLEARRSQGWIKRLKNSVGWPSIVKPVNLGSSIGVGAAHTEEELIELVNFVLMKDSAAIIEPLVQNLVEYNVALINDNGIIRTSAIERPKSSAEVLDFKEKYLSSGGGKKGVLPSQGMLSLSRDINPRIPKALENKILSYAKKAFVALGARGAPRIDFLSNKKTGEIWFNEINAIPGSYGFFLWENAKTKSYLFPELLTHLINEALLDTVKQFDDPVPQDAWLLPR